jgi:hypothetical protein
MGDTSSMSKDQIFRFRLDEADRQRLDALAKHYSAPAATVVRILIAEKAREIGFVVPDATPPSPTATKPKKTAKPKA